MNDDTTKGGTPEQREAWLAEQLTATVADAGRWLVVQVPGTDSFVQYATHHFRSADDAFDHSERTLVIDLPCKAMNWDQSARAATWFKSRGVDAPTEESSYGMSGQKQMLATWKYVVGDDPALAARHGLSLLQTVFELPPMHPFGVEHGYDND